MAHHQFDYEEETGGGEDIIPYTFDIFENYKRSEIALSTQYEEIYPQSTIEGEGNTNPVVFHIHGTDQVMDFSDSYIIITGEMYGDSKLGNAAAVPIDDAASAVGPVNNFPNALFERMTVLLNNKTVTTTNNYGYISYLNTRLNFDTEKLETFFKLQGWIPDDAGNMDSVTVDATTPLGKRRALGNARKTFQFIIRPFASIFTMDKILIPHVDVEIVLDRHPKSSFYLQHAIVQNTVYTYGFNIQKAVLLIRKMDTVPRFNMAIEGAMSHSQHPVVYYLRNPQIIVQNIPAGATLFSQNDLFHGYIPERVLVMFVDSSAYRGTANKNPFNFQNFDIRKIGLYKNGVAYPHPELKMRFNHNQFAQAYYMTMKSLQAPNPGAPVISIEEFKNGTTIFSYDLTPDQCGGIDPHTSLGKKANIRLDVEFGADLPNEITALIYYETEVRTAIDHTRDVAVEKNNG